MTFNRDTHRTKKLKRQTRSYSLSKQWFSIIYFCIFFQMNKQIRIIDFHWEILDDKIGWYYPIGMMLFDNDRVLLIKWQAENSSQSFAENKSRRLMCFDATNNVLDPTLNWTSGNLSHWLLRCLWNTMICWKESLVSRHLTSDFCYER